MAREVYSSLSLVEQAWISANVYDKSNEVARYGGIVDTENIRTVSDWALTNGAAFGISKEQANDERLKNKYVVPIDITIPGRSETFHLEIVVDSKYRDAAVLDKSQGSAKDGFRIAKAVKEGVLAKGDLLSGSMTPEDLMKLKAELEGELPETMKDLVDEWTETGRGRGDEHIGPRNREEVKETAKKVVGDDEAKKDAIENDEMAPDEQERADEARKIIPAGQEDVIAQILESQGLSLADVTQISELQNTDLLDREARIDNGALAKGKSSLVIRVRNKSMDGSASDHMLVIQDGQLVNTEGKDKEISDCIDKYGGRNSSVIKTTENDAYERLEFRNRKGQVQETKVYGIERPLNTAEQIEFERRLEQLEAERNMKLKEKHDEFLSTSDPDERKALLNDIKYIQIGYGSEIRQLAALYAVEMPEYDKDLGEGIEEAKDNARNEPDVTDEDLAHYHLPPEEHVLGGNNNNN